MNGGEFIGLVTVVLLFGTPLLAVFGWMLIEVVKVLKGKPSKDRKLDVSETKLIQNIHQGLARMEERVEALETILLELGRKEH